MRYYAQSVMKLELTKEEMACCKKFANFLSEYAEEVDDNLDTMSNILTIMEDIDDNQCDKDLLLKKYHIEIELI